MQAKPIPAAKIEALREALERDSEVRFKNGSHVERFTGGEGIVTDESGSSWDRLPNYLIVTRPSGGTIRYPDDDSGLRSAYAMALEGPIRKAQPSGDPTMFGDDPPF